MAPAAVPEGFERLFARLHSFALNISRACGVTDVSEAIYTNALSLDCLVAYGQPISEN